MKRNKKFQNQSSVKSARKVKYCEDSECENPNKHIAHPSGISVESSPINKEEQSFENEKETNKLIFKER